MVLQVRLLGGVSAVTGHGEPADIGPAKCQALLAALALSAGKAVPVWRLVELIWGDEPPRTAERTLQSYATRLRRSLGPGSVVRAGAAYRLDVAAGDDALTAIGRLTELTAAYPFREGLWALLITALYRTGRQADALAAYHTARGNLIEHLGVEPGPALRELESLILGHDERLEVPRIRTDRASRPTGTVTFGFCEAADPGWWWATHRREMTEAMARHDELVRALTVKEQFGDREALEYMRRTLERLASGQ